MDIAWGLLQSHDRSGVHTDVSEVDWTVFIDCRANYERITAVGKEIGEELEEHCSEQLSTCLGQKDGTGAWKICNTEQLLVIVKTVAV